MNQTTSHISGRAGADGVTIDISSGKLVGVGQIRFYGRDELRALFAGPLWTILSLEHISITSMTDGSEHAEWRLIARKN